MIHKIHTVINCLKSSQKCLSWYRSTCPGTRNLTSGFDLSWNRVEACEGVPNNKHLPRTPKDRQDCDLCLKIQWLRVWYIHPWGVSAELKSSLSLRAFISSKRRGKHSAPDAQGSFLGWWRKSLGEVFAIGLFWSCYSFQPKNKSGHQESP